MYRVYCDSLLLYHSKLESLKIYDASVELELNKTGSFLFTVYPDHPHYALIKKLKSIITVYQNDYLIFRGRVLNETIGFYNEKHIECEGELSFLLDTVKRPFAFSGSTGDLFRLLVSDHNSQVEEAKRFSVGVVDIPEYIIDIESDDYSSIWSLFEKYLLSDSGFVTVRHEYGKNYIDYRSDFSLLSQQKVTFAKNLLDMKRIRKGEDIATAVIPIGKDGLTISSINGGVDYVSDLDAVEQYGFIVKAVKFDSIDDVSQLKREGEAHLASLVNMTETIELNAADMATVDTNFSSFHLGTYVKVTSNPNGIDQNFLVKKLSLNILDPASNKMTFGKSVSSISDAVSGLYDSKGVILQEIEKAVKAAPQAAHEVEQRLSSAIQQTESRITANVSENYYLKGQTDSLVSSVRTELEQTAQAFEFRFTEFETDVESLSSGTDASFSEIRKYIRFENGNIILGESGNELTLKIQNNRISFLDENHEVAYFSNQKLFVTDAEFLNSIRLGNFAFVPRQSGNLSFMKVV